MRHLPVHWHDGLFLRAQHFQAADRAWSETRRTSERWDHPYNYGLQTIEFSRDALANGFFEISRLGARMPDGTLIDLQHANSPDRVSLTSGLNALQPADLNAAFVSTAVVRVYLAIPRERHGGPNVSRQNGHPATTRYLQRESLFQDDSAGGNDQEISVRELNVRVLLSTDDLSGYDVLPIAQVRRTSAEDSAPELDPEYIPPVIAVDAWPELSRGLFRAIYDVIGRKADVLGRELNSRGIHLDGQTPGDLERILMLSALNEAEATLGVQTFSQGLHPWAAYQEVCRIAGRLATFTPARRLESLPTYDHDDLQSIFKTIKQRIEESLAQVREYEYRRRDFTGAGLGMQVAVDEDWGQSSWHWFVGIHNAELSDRDIRELLSPGHLDWKLGSVGQVDELFSRRATGLQLQPLNRTVRALPPRSDWLYYEIPRADTPAWQDVLESNSLAIRFQEELVMNREELPGSHEIQVKFRGRPTALRFALFAVPGRD